MRKALLLAALLLCLPVWSEAQSCDGCGIGYRPSSLSSSGGTLSGSLALSSGAKLSLYNTTDLVNYELFETVWNSNYIYLRTVAAGSGTQRGMVINAGASGFLFQIGGTSKWDLTASRLGPSTTDSQQIGDTNVQITTLYATRSVQGSKQLALVEGAATNFVSVAVPQTAGVNHAGGEIRYSVYATDGTDSQTLNGVALFSAVNKAGTETCTIEDDQITDEAASSGTLACTITCVVGLTDIVAVAANCTSSLAQTTMNVLYRLDMPKMNTMTPGT